MVFTKTSILLFCFILGTSVFPSGSSSGLVYAMPPPDYINQGLRELQNRINSQVPLNGGSGIYGSLTNQIGNDFVVTGVRSDVTFGSNAQQKFNNFNDNQSPGVKTYGSTTHQGFNSYQISNVEGKMTMGSNTYQEGNKF
uniref:Uncharacterized protein n=1 Tax=Glyptapanteles flavicoxis TaxID=463051 RepID=B7S896_9HYME|nr:conserved hypothetical protein [Glyptapanteles flavicoxis]